jgi:hypothetical protein
MRPGIASVAWFAALRSFAVLVLGAILFAAPLRAAQVGPLAQDEPQAQKLLEQLLGDDRGTRGAAFERWLAQSSPADPRPALLELVERGNPLVLDALLRRAFPIEDEFTRSLAADLRVLRVAGVPLAVLDDLDATLDRLRLHAEHVEVLLDPTFTSGDVLELDGELLILAARR